MVVQSRAFSIWNTNAQDWTTVDGRYTVHVGDSSANLPLSAPVTVAQTAGVQYVTVDAPQVLTPGTTATVATTFTNTGDYPANHVQITLTAPQGWTITPATPAPVGNVAPGSHPSAPWQLTPPDNAA